MHTEEQLAVYSSVQVYSSEAGGPHVVYMCVLGEAKASTLTHLTSHSCVSSCFCLLPVVRIKKLLLSGIDVELS